VRETKLQVFSTRWCGDCRRAKLVLDAHNIPYEETLLEEHPEATEFVMRINRGMRSVPTIVFPDGSTLVEPSNVQLTKKLADFWPLKPKP